MHIHSVFIHLHNKPGTPWTGCRPIVRHNRTQTHSHTIGNLETPISLQHMSLDWRKKPEHSGRRQESNGQPWRYKADVLTIKPPCPTFYFMLILFIFIWVKISWKWRLWQPFGGIACRKKSVPGKIRCKTGQAIGISPEEYSYTQCKKKKWSIHIINI